MKKIKLPLLFVSLVIVLSACNFPSRSSSPTQTKAVTVTPASSVSLETTLAVSTPIPPNTPAWLAYDYTCELADGGGTMTMNLVWTDRSNSEEGYKVYRDEKVVAILAPNSTFYVDVAYVAAGKTLRYSVEAFNTDWQFNTSTITYGCQP